MFGAGVSVDAGIPLLGGFVDRMIDIALRKRSRRGALSEVDVELFSEILNVRNDLDAYHGRAAFDDRNIEDLLSILSLGAIGGQSRERRQLDVLARAIAKTIDLECSLLPCQLNMASQLEGHVQYRAFWRHIVNSAVVGGDAPSIITLNYDLVLERSLVGTLAGNEWDPRKNPFPYETVEVTYRCPAISSVIWKLESAEFFGRRDEADYTGYVLKEVNEPSHRHLCITILKPHGSLNFSRDSQIVGSIQDARDNPLILPPVFNKTGEAALEGVWQASLLALRAAINVIVCGYSLPASDAYIQYFLKAALGPNKNLGRILVFDPLLYSGGARAEAMKQRFTNVFSEQVRGRISYQPAPDRGEGRGTFGSLNYMLGNHPREVLFV